MDATAGHRQKAPSDVGLSPTSVPELRRAALPEAAAGGSAVESGGEEDEQVERFYALLANIRALRSMHRTSNVAGAGTDSGGGSSRKRVRGAEPPWRPAFRMEDFEEVVDAEGAKKKERRGAVRRPAGKEAEEEEEEGEVVEGKDRVPVASQRAGVLTSQLATSNRIQRMHALDINF